MRFWKAVHRVIAYESREGRAAEVASWSNAVAAVGIGSAAFLASGWVVAIGVAIAAFLLLRVALAHRLTVWLAAAAGSIAVGGTAGALAWLFAHVIEHPLAPPIAGVAVGFLASLVPAWAYSHLARRRADDVPDSLLEPTRSSRPSMP